MMASKTLTVIQIYPDSIGICLAPGGITVRYQTLNEYHYCVCKYEMNKWAGLQDHPVFIETDSATVLSQFCSTGHPLAHSTLVQYGNPKSNISHNPRNSNSNQHLVVYRQANQEYVDHRDREAAYEYDHTTTLPSTVTIGGFEVPMPQSFRPAEKVLARRGLLTAPEVEA
jgi:hypothetical protein